MGSVSRQRGYAWENEVVNRLRGYGWPHVYRLGGASERLPDILAMHPRLGRALLIECKATSLSPTSCNCTQLERYIDWAAALRYPGAEILVAMRMLGAQKRGPRSGDAPRREMWLRYRWRECAPLTERDRDSTVNWYHASDGRVAVVAPGASGNFHAEFARQALFEELAPPVGLPEALSP